jgi:membrane associated rhomboid family serine protease
LRHSWRWLRCGRGTNLLHANAAHLLGNAYFLLVFGTAVEELLGGLRYAVLLVIADVTGIVTHTLIDPHRNGVLVGASGGISGLIVFYALAFPHVRMRFFVWYRSILYGPPSEQNPLGRWFYMSVRTALGLWVGMQVLGALNQTQGFTRVSSGAHLGGAAVGLGAWLLWQR